MKETQRERERVKSKGLNIRDEWEEHKGWQRSDEMEMLPLPIQ